MPSRPARLDRRERWEALRDRVPALEAAVSGSLSSGINLQTGVRAPSTCGRGGSRHTILDVLGVLSGVWGATYTEDEDRPKGPRPPAILS